MRRPETDLKPAPTAETPGAANSDTPPLILLCSGSPDKELRVVGSQPVAWHVMKTFAASGVRRFVVCVDSQTSALVDHFLGGEIEDDWQVSLVNTGDGMRPAERIAYASRYLNSHDEHCFVAADTAVADMDFTSFYEQHIARKKPWTVAVVRQRLQSIDAQKTETPAEDTGDEFQPGRCIIIRRRHLAHSLSNGAAQWLEHRHNLGVSAHDNAAVYYHTSFWQDAATHAGCQRLTEVWSQGNAPWTASWPLHHGHADAATKAA